MVRQVSRRIATPELVDAESSHGHIVHPAARVGDLVFVDRGVRYGGGMNNLFAKANYAAGEVARELDREIIMAARRLRLTTE